MNFNDVPFDMAQAHWDRWREFFVPIGGYHYNAHFFRFITNEVICTATKPEPVDRRLYSELGVRLIATGDHKCPKLYMPDDEGNASDEVVPQTALTEHGNQYCLVDLNTGHVVRLHRGEVWKNHPAMPVRWRGRASAYFAGLGEIPIGGEIEINRPRTLTKEERACISDLRDTAKMWLRTEPKDLEDVERLALTAHPVPAADLIGTTFSELPTALRWRLATNGSTAGRNKTTVPFLCVR
jgi:hypothetical protein